MCKNQKGFTLVELVVVIAILGILAAIAVPKMSFATDNARRAKILADLRIIDGAMQIYYAQNGVYPAQAKVNSSHPLVSSGLLASPPVPPKGPLDGLPAVMEYWTENATTASTNDPWAAYVTGLYNGGPWWSLRYLKETKNW